MRLAVLKNRMLQLSDRDFDERKLGFESFSQFVSTVLRQLVEVSGPECSLRDPGSVKGGADRERVNPDFWRATLDYSSGRHYYWDPGAHTVHALSATQASNPKWVKIPSATPEMLAKWRQEFRDAHPDNKLVEIWSAEARPTRFLPWNLQGQWNGELRRHVSGLLREWATNNSLELELAARVETSESAFRLLRKIAHAWVDRLSEDELRKLPIPLGVAVEAVTANVR